MNLTCIPFFILFIILIPTIETHVLSIRCMGDFLKTEWNSFSNLWDYFLKEVLWTGEEIEGSPVEDYELSKKVEKIEDRLNELEKSFLKVRLKKCHVDEDPSRKTQKCNIGSDGYSQTCTERCSKPKEVVQSTEIPENLIEKPLCVTSNVINFKLETNININDKSSPISSDYVSIKLTVYQFKFVILLLVFLLLTVGLIFFFYQKMRTLGNITASLNEQKVSLQQPAANSSIERVTNQDEIVSYNADDLDEGSDSETRDTAVSRNGDISEKGFDSESTATVISRNSDVSEKGFDSESRATTISRNGDVSEKRFDIESRAMEEKTAIVEEWTPEKVYDHLKRISEIAVKAYPKNKNVKYLSDEFLTQIANFIAVQGCFRNFERYLAPEELLQHARHYRHLLKTHASGEKERKVHVIVNVDGQQIQTAGLESSSSI